MNVPLLIISYFSVYIFLFLLYSFVRKKFSINATSFLFLLYAFSGVCSYIFYLFSNGVNRNYSNITTTPFIYLVLCIIISLLPIYRYDNFSPQIVISKRQFAIIDSLSYVLVFCCVLPLIETIVYLPNAFSSDTFIGEMYDKRLMGIHVQDYLSWISRKFYYVIMLCSLLLPVCLFVQLKKKAVNTKLVIGLVFSVILDALHNMINGGRSSFMQNLLYIIIVYFLFKNQISNNNRNKIRIGGLIAMSVSALAMMVVTISRYINDNSGIYDNSFIWLTLYAGEGPLNFNNDLWYVDKTVGGYKTCGLIIGVLSGHFVTVKDLWELGDKLGVAGNIFYTWIGTLCMDWGKLSTFIIVLLSSFSVFSFIVKRRKMTIVSFILMCLWARILVLGPIFYTYSTIESQYCLLVCFLFCLLLNSKIANR